MFDANGRKVDPEVRYRELVGAAAFTVLEALRAEIVRVLGGFGMAVISERDLDRPVRGLRASEDVVVGEPITVRDAEAVVVAGNWEVDAAWPHIAALLASESTDKRLLLAAIEALATIRPDEAPEILGDLLDSDDEDIVDAAQEALAMAIGLSEDDDEE